MEYPNAQLESSRVKASRYFSINLKIETYNEKMDGTFKYFIIVSYPVFYHSLFTIILLPHMTIHTFRQITVK
jgi:hypothetical protein